MKKILILIIVLLASALYFHDELKQIISPPEVTVKYKDLVERDGLTYQKFSEVPFTGKVSGSEKGLFKNGKREGAWVSYWDNGQLKSKGNDRNDERDGAWIRYWDNGQLQYKGNYKSGTRGDYKNGTIDDAWIEYYRNGQLKSKGKWKNGKWEEVNPFTRATTFYWDFDRIRKHGGYVYFWWLSDLRKPSKNGYLSYEHYYQGDCKLFRLKTLSYSYYTQPMGKGTPSKSSNKPDKEWEYPFPNSANHFTLKSICSR